ncbi:MAG: alanine racemase [Thiotrichales bacterium]|nr:alanine racemase [Thiotrichales bacterium]
MYRPTKAYIHLAALHHNLQVVKSTAPNSKVLAVIKANGYGHGILRVAHSLSSADGFGVASIDEALILRQEGFLHRILLLEGLFGENELALVYQHRLDLVIHSKHQLDWLLQSSFQGQINVWVKIDTGMHRLGFDLDQVEWVIDQLQQSKKPFQIHLMSHLASADESITFTEKQIAAFNSVAAQFNYPKSLANSAGLQGFKTTHFEWVRPGIMLYGSAQQPCLKSDLKQVMTLASEVTSLKWIPKGEFVGYGNTWQAMRDTYVAIVAIGYGDGYPRHAPEGTPVLINGHKQPLIGRVSMDMICVDVTEMAQTIQIGDLAVLWGDDSLTVDEVAQLCGTIGYELLCGVTQRVPIVEVK